MRNRLMIVGDIGLEDTAYERWQSWRSGLEDDLGARADHHSSGDTAPVAAPLPKTIESALLSGRSESLTPVCADLNEFVVVGFDGSDARDFLQGYLTCDVTSLNDDNALPGAFTNLQGRVLTDCTLLTVDGMPAVVVHRSVRSTLEAALQKYLFFTKSKFVDLTERYLVLGVLAPPADGELPIPQAGVVANWESGRMVAQHGGVQRLWALLPPDAARRLWREYHTVHQTSDATAWHVADIQDGIAHIKAETSGKFLPQMLDLDKRGAISFSKGCYLGQEVVARAQHRGQVKRRVTRLDWTGPAAPPCGASLADHDGRNRGTLIAAAPVSGDGRSLKGIALAVMTQTDAPATLYAGDAVFEYAVAVEPTSPRR